jgi:hypothetical protein
MVKYFQKRNMVTKHKALFWKFSPRTSMRGFPKQQESPKSAVGNALANVTKFLNKNLVNSKRPMKQMYLNSITYQCVWKFERNLQGMWKFFAWAILVTKLTKEFLSNAEINQFLTENYNYFGFTKEFLSKLSNQDGPSVEFSHTLQISFEFLNILVSEAVRVHLFHRSLGIYQVFFWKLGNICRGIPDGRFWWFLLLWKAPHWSPWGELSKEYFVLGNHVSISEIVYHGSYIV